MTIKQDWNNWREACRNTKKVANELSTMSEQMIVSCSRGQFFDNYVKKLRFGDSLKRIQHIDINQKAIECRASSCFYKLETDNNQKSLYDKCVHVRYNGEVADRHCEGCQHFPEIKNYIDLRNKLETAQAEQYKSMTVLLEHFLFWKKQKNK